MSGGLVPSRSTVYIGNLPFALTNNDIHKVFGKIARIVKVTILKDRVTRESKGVAFIQFINRESAIKACKTVNNKRLFGRKIKCVIAKDNGRASEFIRKKEYPDKSSCYECGEAGHLSYNCPKNILGDREPPPKKEKKSKREKELEKFMAMKKMKEYHDDEDHEDMNTEDMGEDLYESSLSHAIEMEAAAIESRWNAQQQDYQQGESTSNWDAKNSTRKKIKKASYFSDEEEEEEEDNCIEF